MAGLEDEGKNQHDRTSQLAKSALDVRCLHIGRSGMNFLLRSVSISLFTKFLA